MMPNALFSMPIFTSQHLEGRVRPYPRKLATYRKRTLKRWAKNPAHWIEPQILRVGNQFWCAPSELPRITQILASAGLGAR